VRVKAFFACFTAGAFSLAGAAEKQDSLFGVADAPAALGMTIFYGFLWF
jgi:hypothetical protein